MPAPNPLFLRGGMILKRPVFEAFIEGLLGTSKGRENMLRTSEANTGRTRSLVHCSRTDWLPVEKNKKVKLR
jgi:hypothetical protein